MARTQSKRRAKFQSPLGPDALILQSFRGTEELGRLSQVDVELLSDDGRILFKDVVGQNVTIALERPDGEIRYFNGFVNRFRQIGDRGRLAAYTATVVPWLWFLTRVSDCRIWQNKTVPDIIKEIFRDRGFSDFDDSGLSGTYTPWENCVQYRETDFSFVSRLMEHEGIYYYFAHEDGKHTLMLADSPSGHAPTAGYEQIGFHPPDGQVHRAERIITWEVAQEVRSGRYALNDFDFKVPGKALVTASNVPREHAYADLELYDYPGAYEEHGDGDTYARVRIEEEQTPFEVASGKSDCRALASGATFTLADHPRPDRNVEYLLTSVRHAYAAEKLDSTGVGGSGDDDESDYACEFTCIEVARPFRSQRLTPKPIVQGPQTAVVTGPAGETIHCDKFGRVKVHFHWDRAGKMDDNSSCWIRVSQNWGGGGWGGMFLPHVGHEVIVNFLEGDPDLPIITGRVYNGDKAPPLGLPGNKSKSAIRDHGGNEIIMEGAAGKQQMRMHSPTHGSTITLGNSIVMDTLSYCKENFGLDRDSVIGKNWVTKVGGDNNTFTGGNIRDVIMGAKNELCVGFHDEMKIGAHLECHIGAHVDLVLAYNKSITPLEKDEVAIALRKIGSELEKVDKHVKIATTVFEKVKTLDQDVHVLKCKTGMLEWNCDGIFKLKAGETNITAQSISLTAPGQISVEPKGNLNLKSGGDIKASCSNFQVNGSTFNVNSGTFKVLN